MKTCILSLAGLCMLFLIPDALQAQHANKLKIWNKAKSLQAPAQTSRQHYFLQGSNKKQSVLLANPYSEGANRNIFHKNVEKAYKNTPAAGDLNAGSLDPGIFYNPEEPATPAARILKPLLEIDPEMVLNPDRTFPKRTP